MNETTINEIRTEVMNLEAKRFAAVTDSIASSTDRDVDANIDRAFHIQKAIDNSIGRLTVVQLSEWLGEIHIRKVMAETEHRVVIEAMGRIQDEL